jgi:uncharacterized membrane protein HdeD (DUF308 family)
VTTTDGKQPELYELREPHERKTIGPFVSFHHWRWWTVALRGVAAVLFGLLSLFAPSSAFLTLVILFGVYAIVNGALALGLASRAAKPARGTMIAQGIVSILAGIVVLVWPQISAIALLVVIAAWAVASGILEVVTAIRLRKQLEHEWLLGLEGALSIAFGVLLIMAPLAGVVVLGLWVGTFALILGGMLISTGFRIRAFEHTHPTSALAA